MKQKNNIKKVIKAKIANVANPQKSLPVMRVVEKEKVVRCLMINF